MPSREVNDCIHGKASCNVRSDAFRDTATAEDTLTLFFLLPAVRLLYISFGPNLIRVTVGNLL